MDETYDVVVVGGGAAGLSGAVVLARSRRSVLLVDAGDPRNAVAGHVHNMLTRDGVPPADLYRAGRHELESYGGAVADARVESVRREGDGFVVRTTDPSGPPENARTVSARRLLVATGTRDELPDVPGLAQRWGRDVLHCAYCHGWEVRDQRIGVLATSAMSVHQALLFRNLSDRVVLVEHAGFRPTPEQEEQLASIGIARQTGPAVQVEVTTDGGALRGVRLADGSVIEVDVLVVAPVSRARAELLAPLGIRAEEVRAGEDLVGTQVPVDATGHAAPGVWAAGNVADVRGQVMTSASAGLTAGAAVNADLVMADVRRAVHAQHAAPPQTALEWDQRYTEMDQVWSGAPNGTVVHEASRLPPGRALDVGCGEGGDALWLAGRGWEVTALDVSSVALARAQALADRAGAKVTWLHAGLLEADLGSQGYDLVSVQYPALLRTPGRDAERRLLASVAPGGTLLVVHHAHLDADRTRSDGWDPGDYVMPGDIAEVLDDQWDVEVHETRERHVSGGAGAHHSHDLVLRARRLS